MDSDDHRRRAGQQRRTARWLLITVGLMLSGAVLGLRQWQRGVETQELIEELEAAGGYADTGRPAWDRLFASLEEGAIYDDDPEVSLDGPVFDDRWLEDHDQLKLLRIHSLMISDTRVSDEGVARLLDAHQIKWLDLAHTPAIGSATLAALHAQTRLDYVILDRAALSDQQLSALPLERLFMLSIEETPVTPQGLLELRRCQRLGELWIDGVHLDEKSAECLRSIPTLQNLYVMNENVTDEVVRLLRGMTQLHIVHFEGKHVTEAALDDLRKSLPECEVGDDF